MEAHRFFIRLAYDGSLYNGWQVQPNGRSLQATLEESMAVCFGQKIEVTGAGRTDTGVHAAEMYAHFDLSFDIGEEKFPQTIWKLNNLLPTDIVVYDIIPVGADAHARFDAVSRTYRYHILTRKNPFRERFCWYWQGRLDVEIMNGAAEMLLGKHDFQCFSKVNTDVSNFLCEVTEAFWKEEGDELVFTITANRFLRNMVRAIVGTLYDIGRGKTRPSEIKSIMESHNRSKAGSSVPAKGLILTRIVYPYKLRANL